MMLRNMLVACALGLCSITAGALEHPAAVALYVELNKLDMDTIMMLYDEGDRDASSSVAKRLDAMEPAISTMIAEVMAMDGDAGKQDRENWDIIHRALRGEGGAPGMIGGGYDAQAFAEYRNALGELLRDLSARNKLAADGSRQDQAYMLAARVMAVYIRTAGSPFGSYSDNNDESINEDLGQMTARLDAMLAGLATDATGDAAREKTMKSVGMKWRFIRSAIVRYTQLSTPTVVYRQGTDILGMLATIR